MASEAEIEIREKIREINSETDNIIQTANGDIKNANLAKFFQLVDQLDHINATRNAPNINGRVSQLVNFCRSNGPESIEKYQEILDLTQRFIDEIRN